MESSQRQLRTLDAISLMVGSMVGAGIFSVLALTVQTAGASAVLSWIFIVILSLPMVFTFSDLVGVLGQSGGPYVYIRNKASSWLGLWTAWLFLVSAAGAAEALLIALVHMLAEVHVPYGEFFGCMIVVALAVVTALGIHMGAMVQRILTVGTVALLLLCVCIGLVHPIQLHPASTGYLFKPGAMFPHGWGAVLPATFFAFWTYSGWEAVAVPSGSYGDRRSLARGMIIGSLVVGCLYILVAVAAVISVPAADLTAYMNPLLLVGRLWGPFAASVVGWGALLIVIGSLLSWLIATASLVQAMIRDGVLPAPRAIRGYTGEYHVSLPFVVAVLLIAMSVLPLFAPAVAASSMTALLGYGIVFAVVLSDSNSWEGIIKTHSVRRTLAGMSLAVTIALIVFSGWGNLWPTFVLCAAGAVLLIVRKRHWECASFQPRG